MEPLCGTMVCANPGRFLTMLSGDTLRIMALALCRY